VAVRVQLIDDALADLKKLAESGKLRLFLRKLIEIEQKGSNAGVPLGRDLASWRKLTVGDRNWRIVFRVDAQETVATVCAVGDREDEVCYRQARERAGDLENGDVVSLAEAMMELHGSRKERRAAQRRRAAEARRN
jgi:mRNA interferase RelE/StbE